MSEDQTKGLQIQDHYRNWAQANRNSWVLSEGYFSFWASQVIELLELKPADKILDLGAGNGKLAGTIAKTIQPQAPIVCVEPLGVFEGEPDPHFITHHVETAEQFLRKTAPGTFNKVLVKQAIHHFHDLAPQELARLSYKIVGEVGQLLILIMPPEIEYPTFAALRERFKRNQPDFSSLESDFLHSGFTVAKGFRDYPVQVTKDAYFEAIRANYISDLASFSPKEIESGIQEIRDDNGDPEVYQFPDRLYFFLMMKNYTRNIAAIREGAYLPEPQSGRSPL